MSSSSIQSIRCRRILNSHGAFTNEFVVFLSDRSVGRGASPQGESISIYEDKELSVSPEQVIGTLREEGMFGTPLTQEEFDAYLDGKMEAFGRNNAYALSLAFYDAKVHFGQVESVETSREGNAFLPRFCINILNGGNHAYTNPVQSEFQEYLLVPKSNDLLALMEQHGPIQDRVKEKLASREKTYVNKNMVSKAVHGDSREWFDFLEEVLRELGLESEYVQMIDASAGDLWDGEAYHFAITDGSHRKPEAMVGYWKEVVENHNLRILEDPFHETDFAAWQALTNTQDKCKIIGDNLYSGDAERIAHGIREKYSHGIILKPNQAGTVTNTLRAIDLVQSQGHTLITSHRSISTESTFLAHITHRFGAEFVKNGPILSDYSSVVRMNEFIRYAGLGYQ